VHRRLDDDFPEISQTLLEMLHPQLVRPVPAMCIIDAARRGAGRLPRHFVAQAARYIPVGQQRRACSARSSTPDAVAVHRTAAQWTSADRAGGGSYGRDAVGNIRLEIAPSTAWLSLPIARCDCISRVMQAWPTRYYELLLNNASPVVVRNRTTPAPGMILGPNGDARGRRAVILPFPTRTFSSFACCSSCSHSQKFRFVDLQGFGAALRSLGAWSRRDPDS
jgi:type VI secretion system protein ImpG